MAVQAYDQLVGVFGIGTVLLRGKAPDSVLGKIMYILMGSGKALAAKVRAQFRGRIDLVVSPAMGGVVVGYEVHPNLALEGVAVTNVDTDTISLNGSEVAGASLKVQRAFGFFIKPKVMLTPEWELFGRLGSIENKTKAQYGSLSATQTEHDLAYGIGLNYHFNKTTYGSLGYSSFYDKQNTTARGATLAVGMKF